MYMCVCYENFSRGFLFFFFFHYSYYYYLLLPTVVCVYILQPWYNVRRARSCLFTRVLYASVSNKLNGSLIRTRDNYVRARLNTTVGHHGGRGR